VKFVRLPIFFIPFIFGCLIVYILSSIFYYEGRRENILSLIETKYIELLLAFNPKTQAQHESLLIVSAMDHDKKVFLSSKFNELNDLGLSSYKNIIQIVLDKYKPDFIYINPLSTAHSQESLELFLRSFIHHPMSKRLIFTLSLRSQVDLPLDIRTHLNILQAMDCVYEINSYCTIQSGWVERGWVPQHIHENLWPDPKPFRISSNLPHIFPNILLKLRRDPETISFTDTITRTDSTAKKVVFIGNSMTQPAIYANNKEVVLKTMHAAGRFQPSDLSKDGIAYHEFWALITDLFLSDAAVSVAPREFAFIIIAFWTLTLLALFSLQSFAFSVPLYLLFLLALSVVNFLGLRYLNFFIPIAEIAFANFSGIVLIGAAYFSFITYKRSKQRDLDRHIVQTDISRNNFIALISHNLVTPLARLITILEALKRRVEGNTIDALQYTLFQSHQLLVALKSVLLHISIQQGKQFPNDMPLSEYVEQQLKAELQVLTKKYGFVFEWEHSNEDSQTLKISSKVITQILLCYIYALNAKELRMQVNIFCPPLGPPRLHISTLHILKYSDSNFADFLSNVFSKLVVSVSKYVECKVEEGLIFDFRREGLVNEKRI
jgi:hypothetical protein